MIRSYRGVTNSLEIPQLGESRDYTSLTSIVLLVINKHGLSSSTAGEDLIKLEQII